MTKPTTVDAFPTKELFISMLVKDIPLSRAILDLVDNSIDGARKLRPNGDFKDLFINVSFDKKGFNIQDNCGGISVDDAVNYAFRFGRPDGVKALKHSVGQFGIGMKRALFKIGAQFKIDTTTARSHFVIDENVLQWKKNEKDWTFKLNDLSTKSFPKSSIGTSISITQLYSHIANEFETDTFFNTLRLELEAAHCDSISRGLSIKLGNENLPPKILYLRSGTQIKPAYRKHSIRKADVIRVRLYAGVAESKPNEAGWYIFCNGRMLVEADQTIMTGWGDEEEVKVPKYHNQFAHFRGYVFFDSDSASLLPWNTTKTGIDADSELYNGTRQEMMNMTRPVIDFLNELKEDKEGNSASSALLEILERTTLHPVDEIVVRNSFLSPSIGSVESKNTRISYLKPRKLFDIVKKKIRAKDAKEVGEKTFEYFYNQECTD